MIDIKVGNQTIAINPWNVLCVTTDGDVLLIRMVDDYEVTIPGGAANRDEVVQKMTAVLYPRVSA